MELGTTSSLIYFSGINSETISIDANTYLLVIWSYYFMFWGSYLF